MKSLSQVPSEHLVPVLSQVIIKKDPVSPPNLGVKRRGGGGGGVTMDFGAL